MRNFMYLVVLVFLAEGHLFGSVSSSESNVVKKYKLFSSFVKTYLNLYKSSPACFFPYENIYSKSKRELHRRFKLSICSDGMSDFCKNNKRLTDFVMRKNLKEHDFNQVLPQKKCVVNPETKQIFLSVRKTLIASKETFLATILDYLANINLLEDSKKDLASLKKRFDISLQNNLKIFAGTFFDELLVYPHKILLSKPLIKLARAGFYNLEDIDMIRALDVEKNDLKKEFLSSRDSNSSTLLFGLDKIRVNRDILIKLEFFKDEIFDSKYFFQILMNHVVQDKRVLELLLQQKYQRVIWLLRDLGFDKKANSLENMIIDKLFIEKDKKEVKNLDLGFSDTFRVFFEGGVSVIYKPKITFLNSPLKSFTSHYKREVAAFIVDRLLNLNMVPLTFVSKFRNNQLGSSQYFVKDAYRARDMNEYDRKKPRKFDSPKGRITKSKHMLLFDWLIDNRDRNIDNYMLLDTGKVVLIDHGLSFVNLAAPPFISKKSIKRMMPSKEIFIKLKKLNKNPKLIFSKLSPYLSKSKIKILISKISLFVSTVEKLQKKNKLSNNFKPTESSQPSVICY